MRVLILNPVGTPGGAERVLLAGANGVQQARSDVVVRVLSLSDGPLLAAAAALGCETEVIPLPATLARLGDSELRGAGWRGIAALVGRAVPAAIGGVTFVRRLRAAVRRFRPDVVHSHGIKTHLLSRLVVPVEVSVVWHLHDFYTLRPAAARLLRAARGRVRAGVAISDAVRRDTATALPGLAVDTVPNAVDLRRFAPGPGDGAELDRLAGLPEAPTQTVRVGLVATYARWKGQLLLLDAAAHLAADAPELAVRWYIVGGPIYQTAAQFTEAELRIAAAARGVAERIGFVPFQPDPAGVYRALDVVVHASTLPEPFGLTIAEAMACGRPVVISAAGGAAELFTEGVDAIGFLPGHAQQLAAAVRRLANDYELRDRLGTAAHRTAEQCFNDLRYGKQLLLMYERVLTAKKAG